jgi:hypothetical protein
VVGQNGTVSNTGLFKIETGTYNVGAASGNDLSTGGVTTGRFEMLGGTLSVTGSLINTAGIAIITGGTINIATLGNSSSSVGSFHMSLSTDLTITGSPTIIIHKANTTGFNDINILNSTGTKTITGGTFQLGSSSTSPGSTFSVYSDIALYTLRIFNNSVKANLTANLTVNNQLTLNGPLQLNNYNLTLGTTATAINGTLGSGNGLIITNGTGEVRKLMTANGAFVFPVASSATDYAPVTLTFTSGNYAGGAYAGVRTINSKHPNNANSNNYLNRYWSVTTGGITSPNYSVTAVYNATDVFGSDANIGMGSFTILPWVKYGAANTGIKTLTAAGITGTGSIAFSGITLANPTCSISGNTNLCIGTNNTYTVTTDGTSPTYSWSLINNTSGASIVSTSGNTVIINPGSSAGSYQVQVNITANEGTSSCQSSVATVNPLNTVGTASSTPTLCINTALTNITHTTTGATGIGT